MTANQIQVILDRLEVIEGKVDGVYVRIGALEEDRIAREAIEEHSDKVRVRRRDVLSMAASAAAVGGGAASVLWLIFQLMFRPH